MAIEELKSYNAANLACAGNYFQLKKNFDDVRSWQKVWLKIKKDCSIDRDLEWQKLEKNGIKLILANDPEFPLRLREMPWPPLGIYFKGRLVAHDEKCVAVVGTRKATTHGKEIAKNFSSVLSQTGLTVTSGLALGIDTAAHEGALEAEGKTIAVWEPVWIKSIQAPIILSLKKFLIQAGL